MPKKKTSEETSASAPTTTTPRRRLPRKRVESAADSGSPAAIAESPAANTESPAASTGRPASTLVSAPENNRQSEPTQAEIAEAAYYRHLNRGGAEGDEFSDWIEAERELRQRQSR